MRWVAVLLVVGTSGCSEHSECRGQVAHICGTQGEHSENIVCNDIDCDADGRVCVEDSMGQATCAIYQRPQCGSPAPCDGSLMLTCFGDGWVTDTHDCAPNFCTPGVPACTVREGIDAGCAALTNYRQTYCDGDILVGCIREYAVSLTDCGADRCYTFPNDTTGARCIETSAPDPRCTQPSKTEVYRVCSNGTRLECVGTTVVGSVTCNDLQCASCQTP